MLYYRVGSTPLELLYMVIILLVVRLYMFASGYLVILFIVSIFTLFC